MDKNLVKILKTMEKYFAHFLDAKVFSTTLFPREIPPSAPYGGDKMPGWLEKPNTPLQLLPQLGVLPAGLPQLLVQPLCLRVWLGGFCGEKK